MNPPDSTPPNPNPSANRPGPAAPVPPDSGSNKPLTVSIVRKTGTLGNPIATTPVPAAENAAAASTTSSQSSAALPRPEPELGLEAESTRPPQPTPRRRSTTDRLAAWIARPVIAAPAVIACLSLLGWSVFIRRTTHPIIAHARPTPTTTISAPRAEDVADLARQAGVVCSAVVTNIDQLPRLISQLEQQARTAGFSVEVTTHPPQTPVPGVPDLARHPLIFKLENSSDRTEPAFPRFLEWLHQAATIGIKIDPGAVTLQSPGLGLSIATVELGLFSFSSHAKAPSE